MLLLDHAMTGRTVGQPIWPTACAPIHRPIRHLRPVTSDQASISGPR